MKRRAANGNGGGSNGGAGKKRKHYRIKDPEAFRAKQKANANRGAGRPPKTFAYPEGTLRGDLNAARDRGREAISECVDLWIQLVRVGLAFVKGEPSVRNLRGKTRIGHIPEEYAGPIMRATENLANRCGLPTLTETSIKESVPPKMIGEARAGWQDPKSGEWHDIAPEGAPEEVN